MGGAHLAELQPTTAEVERAREILAACDNKQHRAKNASFTHWLKKNPQEGLNIGTMRGDARKALLEKFLIHSMREEDAKLKTTTNNTSSTTGHSVDRHHEWSKETLDKDMGPAKAKSWRDSGNIKHAPCPVTGEGSGLLRIWYVPVAWKDLNTTDTTPLERRGGARRDS